MVRVATRDMTACACGWSDIYFYVHCGELNGPGLAERHCSLAGAACLCDAVCIWCPEMLTWKCCAAGGLQLSTCENI